MPHPTELDLANAPADLAKMRKVVGQVLSDYTTRGLTPDFINDGYCHEFADEVYWRAQDAGLSVRLLSNARLQTADSTAWDPVKLQAECPACEPPDGMSLSDLPVDRFGYHVWPVWNGVHFDAEAPLGVYNFFDLPIFIEGVERVRRDARLVQRAAATRLAGGALDGGLDHEQLRLLIGDCPQLGPCLHALQLLGVDGVRPSLQRAVESYSIRPYPSSVSQLELIQRHFYPDSPDIFREKCLRFVGVDPGPGAVFPPLAAEPDDDPSMN